MSKFLPIQFIQLHLRLNFTGSRELFEISIFHQLFANGIQKERQIVLFFCVWFNEETDDITMLTTSPSTDLTKNTDTINGSQCRLVKCNGSNIISYMWKVTSFHRVIWIETLWMAASTMVVVVVWWHQRWKRRRWRCHCNVSNRMNTATWTMLLCVYVHVKICFMHVFQAKTKSLRK